jgi:hypothetical protein
MDDMGARLEVPSSFKVPIRATGVPKYKIAGSVIWCIMYAPLLFIPRKAYTIGKLATPVSCV